MDTLWGDLTPEELRTAQYLATQTFYWEKKDVGSYTLLARSILELLLQYAQKHPEMREEYADIAIRTAYNIASMTWSGWDEEGINLDAEHRKLGLQAAEFSLWLASQMNMPAERRQNGLWMLGAQQLANGMHQEARETFHEQMAVISNEGLEEHSLMAKCWIEATSLLMGESSEAELEALLTEMAATEAGSEQVGFLRQALRVFSA